MNMKRAKVWDKWNKISVWSCPHHGETSGMHGPPWRCLFSNLEFHKFHKHAIVVDSSGYTGYGSTKLPEKSIHILRRWFIIYIYNVIDTLYTYISFFLTTTNSLPSTHIPTQKAQKTIFQTFRQTVQNLCFLQIDYSRRRCTGDFLLKTSTHRETWLSQLVFTSRMFWVNHCAGLFLVKKTRSDSFKLFTPPKKQHISTPIMLIRKGPKYFFVERSVGPYYSKWWFCWDAYNRTKEDAMSVLERLGWSSNL